VARKEKGGQRVQRIGKRLCSADLRRCETGMAAAARTARGVIGRHTPALQIVRQSRSRSTQLQRLQDRLAESLELRRGRMRWKKEEGGRRAQRTKSVGVRRTCGIARRQPSKRASAACGGEEGGRREGKRLCPADLRRRETGMAAAAQAARGTIGGHSPALRIMRQSRSRSTQLQRLQDRLAESLESRQDHPRWKKEEGGRRAQRTISVGVRRTCGIARRQLSN
jgi:hypothetical protein